MTFTLQTLMPSALTPSSQTVVTDIDQDGTNELIVFDPSLAQLTLIHQFRYSDITLNQISPTVWPTQTAALWPTYTDQQWMTVWAAQQGIIPAAQGSGGWSIQPGDQILAADLNGDHIDELFIYNLFSSSWGVIQWNSHTNQLQTIYQVVVTPPTTPISPPLTVIWPVSTSDQYFVIPNMTGLFSTVPGDGILLYNSQTLAMGMISYQSSPPQFLQQWSTGATSLNNWDLTQSPNEFYVGNFAKAGTPSVVVYGKNDQYINLLTWDGSNLGGAYKAQNGTIGGWYFQSSDQFQCADLDGDGLTEILLYNPGYLGVLKWNTTSNQFETLAVAHNSITTGSNSWTIDTNNQFFCKNGTGGNPGQIYAFSPDPKLAVLNYQKSNNNNSDGTFNCQWSGTSLSANNGWPINPTDSFYAGSPSNTSTPPTLFTLSNQQGSAVLPKVKLGAVTWTAPTLQIVSSSNAPVQTWSPSFLAAAPQLGFKLFTDGNQPAIYTYISNLFPLPTDPDPPNNNIRNLYYNAPDKSKFESFAAAIRVVKSPQLIPNTWANQPPPGNTWTESDWGPVVQTIAHECIAVDTVYSLIDAVSQVSTDLNNDQNANWEKVIANIQAATQADPSALSYWLGQFTVMLLWGLAASGGLLFPGEEQAAAAMAFGVVNSMNASLVGSALGYDPNQQQTYSVDDIKAELFQAYANSATALSQQLTTFLKDAIKLQVCHGLHESEWKIHTSLGATASGPFTTMNRIWLYQQLMPLYFNIPIFSLGASGQSEFALYQQGNYGWALGAGSNYLTKSQFTVSLLNKDLFVALNVSQSAFFLGTGPWANIPRFLAKGNIS